MSPTKRTSLDRQISITNHKLIVRAARAMLAAAIVLALVGPASAVLISWTGTTAGLWSDSSKWTPTGTPISASDVQFTNTGVVALTTPPTVTNQVSSSLSINSLQYIQSVDVHTTQINPSVLMRVLGSVADPGSTGLNGNISLWAGAVGPNSNSISQTLFTGGGQMDISNASGGNTGGDIIVRETQGTAGAHNAILDLSGLASLNANIDQILVSFSAGSQERPNGTLYLAQSNTITMNNPGVTTNSGLVVGHAYHNGSGQPSYLYLGQTNNLNVDNVTIASRRATSTMTFNPAFIGSTPTLTMRGIAGGTSRVANIFIGDNFTDSSGKTNTANGTINLTGGIADIKATTITLGRSTPNGGTASQASSGRGTLTFNAGTIDVTTLNIGVQSASTTATNSDRGWGVVNVSGTANLVVGSGGIKLATVLVAGSYFPPTGTLNISGGTVTVGGNITDEGITAAGGTSVINMSGGTLNMGGNNIGSSSLPIDTFTASGGGISNLNNLSVSSFRVTNNFAISSGTLTIANNGNIDMRNIAANTLSAGNLSLPASSTLYFDVSNNATSGNDIINIGNLNLSGTAAVKVSLLSGNFSGDPYPLISYTSETGAGTFTVSNTTRNIMSVVDNSTDKKVYLTVGVVAARDLTWNGGTTGTWDWNTTTNWTSSYGADKYYDLDTVTFGNTGALTAVTLSNAANQTGFYPGSVTVNAGNDYTLSAAAAATDRISGSTGLTKDGTGTLTLNLTNDFTGTTNLNAGKIILNNTINGTDSALGSATGALVIAGGATLDLNVRQLYAKPVTVQGAGVDGNGAIVNNNTTLAPGGTQYDVSNVTLSGNTTIGGISTTGPTNPGLPGNQYIGRWSVRANSGTAMLSTGGNAYNLTKTGNNQIMLVSVDVDTALADVFVNKGVLGLEGTTTLGDPTKTVTVDGTGGGQPSGGSMLQLRILTTPLNKNVSLTNNGVLYALANNSVTDNTVSGPVAIADSGGIFNAGGVRDDYTAATPTAAMTISGVLSGSSSATLTKTGPGTVTLSNTANTFSGTTNLNDGTLAVNGNLPNGLTMAAGTVTTTLAGTGTVGGTVTDAVGTSISPGGNGTAGTLTLNNLTINPLGSGSILMDLSNSTSSGNDLLNVNGHLALNGITNMQINQLNGINSLANGSYRLINYGSWSGSSGGTPAIYLALAGMTTGTRRVYALDDATATQINLNVSGSAATLLWKGDGASNIWDIAITPNNWLNGSTPDVFYNLDTITFDDSGDNTVPVYINTASVTPASITVNSSKNYTIGGWGKISGATGIAKSGTGTLILANSTANDYSGATTINAGTLQVGDGVNWYARLGTGAIVNNAALVLNNTLGDNYSITTVISGSGTLEQKGGNTITLSAANTYTGMTTITSGTIIAGNAAALGTTAAGTVIANGGSLDINNLNLGTEAISVQGSGVGGYGAIVNNNTASSTTPNNALRYVTLSGDTTFGGTSAYSSITPSLPGAANSGRWDIRGTGAYLSTGGNAYKITKVGNNQVSLVGVNVDTMLGDVDVNSGVLNLEGATTGLGDPTKTVTVASGAILNFYNYSTGLNKKVVLNGGTLYAQNNSASSNNTVSGDVAIGDAGGTFNTGGVRSDITAANANTTMTIRGVISGSVGALSKMGPGTVILTAANTYNGALSHNDGTLIVNGSLTGTGGVTMYSSSSTITTLAGTGTISGPVLDSYNTNIAPGASTAFGAVGTLTFGSSLSLGSGGSGKITLDLTNNPSSGNDLIDVVGALMLTGTTNVGVNPISGYLQNGGNYPLIRYGSVSGWINLVSFGVPTTDSRQTFSINNNTSAKTIDLVVTGSVANLKWVGDGGANAWDVKTTSNWLNGSSPDQFWTSDFVTFDDSSANTTVNLNTAVIPGSVTVNTGLSYTITGTGSISAGTLTKQGTGTLTINTANTYNGTTNIAGGKIILGNAAALGNASGALLIASGGTLDLNVQQLYAKPITVQGAGVGGNGAIVNNNTVTAPGGTQYDVSNVTLNGNTTIGGTSTTGPTNPGLPGNQYIGRWSMRAQSGSTATLSTGGNAYNLTKTGNNQIMLVNASVDSALANVFVNKGVLGIEGTTTLGDPTKTVTVNGTGGGQPSGGAILQFRTVSVPLNKNVLLQNNGQLYALANTLDTDNTVAGTLTLDSTGGILNAGGVRDDYAANSAAKLTISGDITGAGGLTKTGPGVAFITSANVNYAGDTDISEGTLQVNSGSGATVALHAVTGVGALGVDNTTNLTVDSLGIGTLTIGAGSTLTIAAIPGGPLAGAGSLSAVPEPSTWAMLMLAAMGLGIYRRRGR